MEIHNQSNNHRWIYKKVILGHLEKVFFQRKSARETMSNIWPECKYHDFRFSIKMPLNKSILDLSSNLRDFQPFFGFISLWSMNFKTNNFEMQTAALWSKNIGCNRLKKRGGPALSFHHCGVRVFWVVTLIVKQWVIWQLLRNRENLLVKGQLKAEKKEGKIFLLEVSLLW